MDRKYMLKCKVLNNQNKIWENKNIFFNDKEDMEYFVKYGGETTKPEEIKVVAAFELNQIDL